MGAFIGEYLRTRGKNLATRVDFESLQAQLRANTQMVETIKAEVGQRDWAEREWTLLRRTKLEALLDKIQECEDLLLRVRLAATEGELLSDATGYHSQMRTLATLYFPELEQQTNDFLAALQEQHVRAIRLGSKIRAAGKDLEARKKVEHEHRCDFTDDMRRAAEILRASAHALLLQIMRVSPDAKR